MATRKKTVDKVEVPMSAMIDIVFLLLVFFIATFKENLVEAHLAVNMPAPSRTKPETNVKLLEIYVLEDRYLLMGTRTITIAALGKWLKDVADYDAEQTVLIKVHGDATERQFVDVLDRCHRAGLKQLNVMRLKE